MIDTTSIGYAIFYAYGFIQEKRFAEWRDKPSIEDPSKTNDQYCVERTERIIARGREEAVKCGIAPLYDEWVETEREFFLRCKNDHVVDEALQLKRLSLAQELHSLGD